MMSSSCRRRYDNIIERLEKKYGGGIVNLESPSGRNNAALQEDDSEEELERRKGEKGKKTKMKKRKNNSELDDRYYDLNDDFIDDSETNLHIESRHRMKSVKTKHSGFFVAAGNLETVGEVEIEGEVNDSDDEGEIEETVSGPIVKEVSANLLRWRDSLRTLIQDEKVLEQGKFPTSKALKELMFQGWSKCTSRADKSWFFSVLIEELHATGKTPAQVKNFFHRAVTRSDSISEEAVRAMDDLKRYADSKGIVQKKIWPDRTPEWAGFKPLMHLVERKAVANECRPWFKEQLVELMSESGFSRKKLLWWIEKHALLPEHAETTSALKALRAEAKEVPISDMEFPLALVDPLAKCSEVCIKKRNYDYFFSCAVALLKPTGMKSDLIAGWLRDKIPQILGEMREVWEVVAEVLSKRCAEIRSTETAPGCEEVWRGVLDDQGVVVALANAYQRYNTMYDIASTNTVGISGKYQVRCYHR
jgi:hypothetical protein